MWDKRKSRLIDLRKIVARSFLNFVFPDTFNIDSCCQCQIVIYTRTLSTRTIFLSVGQHITSKDEELTIRHSY